MNNDNVYTRDTNSENMMIISSVMNMKLSHFQRIDELKEQNVHTHTHTHTHAHTHTHTHTHIHM